MVTILIVEDDAAIRLLTKTKLREKYHITEAENGEAALEILDHSHADLAIVDIMMPKMDGYEFVDLLRKSKNNMPVIMLTAMTSFEHKKKGFASGIDDYMTKPINYEELDWRIEALLRRAKIFSENKIEIGALKLNYDSKNAIWNNHKIELTNLEFELLYKFLSYPEMIFTKQQLLDDIWGYDTDTEYSTIKTYISRLRSKFADCGVFEIVSLRNIGYKAVIRE